MEQKACFLVSQLVRHPGWGVVQKYAMDQAQGARESLVHVDPSNAGKIGQLQGEAQAFALLLARVRDWVKEAERVGGEDE